MTKTPVRALLLVLGLAGVLLLVAVVVALVVVAGGGDGELTSPRGAVRPWAEVEYDALVAPVRPAGRGSEPRYQGGVRAVKWEGDPADATRGSLNVRMRRPAEVWVPGYEVSVLDGGNGFRVEDGGWSVAVDRVEVDGRDGVGGMGIFSPAMVALEGEDGKRTGMGRHVMGANGPVTGISVALTGQGWEGSRVMVHGVFDRATKVRLSDGVGVMDTGDERLIYGELRCVHDAELRVVVDFLGGTAVREVIGAREGEVAGGDDFRVEVLAVMAGRAGLGGRPGRGGGTELSFDVSGVGGDVSLVVCSVMPEAASEAIEIHLIGRDGRALEGVSRWPLGMVTLLGADVKPEELAELEVVYRPERSRLLVDLPPLAGVVAANAGVEDLFDCVIAKGEVTSEYALRQLVAKTVQLDDPLVSTASHARVGIFPLDVGGMTVREVVEVYRGARPEVRLWVDPVEMRLEVVDPVATPWWQRALWKVRGVSR